MKQYLRHMFLLVAMFVATANAWAECYVLEKYTTDSEKYITVESNRDGSSFSESFPVPNGYELTFSYCLSGSSSVSYNHYVAPQYSTDDGANFTDILPEETISTKSRTWRHTKDDDKLTFILPSGTTHIRFRRRASSWFGTRDLYIKNVRVTRISSISVSASTTFPFDPIPVGTTATKTVKINYSNIGTSVYASACDPADVATHFALTSAENLDCAGTVELTLTYQPQTEGTHGGTATISGSNGTSCTINVSGSAFAVVDPTHTWNAPTTYKVGDPNLDLANIWTSTSSGSITYRIKENSFKPSGMNNEGATPPSINGNFLTLGQAGTLVIEMIQEASTGFYAKTSEQTITINKYDVEASISLSTAVRNEIIDNPFSLSYGLTDFDVEAENTNIAEYHKDTKKIQTYFTDGTAYFQITRPEDYKYKELDKTFSIEVKAAGGCNVLATEKDKDYAVGYYADPKEYWFDLEGVGDVLTVELKKQDNSYGYIHIVGYDENGGNETNLGSFNYSEISTDWGDVKTCTILKNEIRKIQIKSGGDIAADALHKYFRNLKVTRKISLDPQVKDDKLYLSQSSNGMIYSGDFTLNWSTCADEIRLKCDNPLFEITPSVISVDANSHGSTPITIRANATNATSLTGELTIYDQTQKKTITLSCEHLLQRIEWNQYFGNLESDEEGNIKETFELDAVAKTVNGNLTNQPISYTLSNITPAGAASISTENGKTYLHITAKCEGTITASVEGYTKDGKTYSSDAVTHDIRVRKAGEPCHTIFNLEDRIELNTIEKSEALFVGDKNPDKLQFIAHRDITAANYFFVVYSTDGGVNWSDLANPMLPQEVPASYEYSIPENTTHIRFETRTGATWNKYVKNIQVTQKSYLDVGATSISETIYVNTPFTKDITLRYSDIPLILKELSQNTTNNLSLAPRQTVNNNCGQFGTYTFTLSGEWAMPQEINETVRFFTSAGDEKTVQVNIVVQTAETVTSVQSGSWNDANTWSNHVIPDATNPVVIQHPITISNSAQAHSVTVQEDGYIHITPTGGLTVHAGGYTSSNTTHDLEITINNDNAGYFRMSPSATTDMPKAMVNFTTRGQLNQGGNSADWQYIGAPGEGAATDILGTTVLYLRSEEKGWVRLKTFRAKLEAFAGYALTQKAQPEFTFYPQLINEDKTIQLTYTSDGMQGDNLWANSYMAPLDITQFNDADFTGHIEKTFYLYNSGSWNKWNENQDATSSSTFTPGRYYAIPVASARALDATYDQNVIPPMQGVYMKANPGGGTITLNYEKHVWKNSQEVQMNNPLRIAGRKESAEEQKPDFQRVRLQVASENSGADRMYIIQDTLTTSGYDNGYDAPKQMADNLMNIYTNEPFGKMEISSTDNMNEMYIGFKAGDDSEYTMTFTSLIGDSLYLYDSEMDTYVKMIELGQYQFSAIPQSTNDMRFQLLVAPELPSDLPEQGGGVTTGTEDITSTRLWINDRTIYMANVQPNSVLSIYTVSGMLVTAPYTLHSAQSTVNIADLPAGVYIIRLNDLACKFVCK